MLLTGCDHGVFGSINNRTDQEIKITCYLNDKSLWEVDPEDSVPIYYDPYEEYFLLSKIDEQDPALHFINDSTVFVNLKPGEHLGFGQPMNTCWTEERLRNCLKYLKRMDIQTSNQVITYEGATQLNDFFLKHIADTYHITIDIKE